MHRIPGPFLLQADRQPHPSPDIMNLQHCNHMILQKKSLAVGRTSSQSPFHCPARGGWGEASFAFARLCPNQLPVYNNQAVHAVSVACRVRGKIALSQSPRVPEFQSLLRIWDTVRTHGGASPLHSELLKAAAGEYCI